MQKNLNYLSEKAAAYTCAAMDKENLNFYPGPSRELQRKYLIYSKCKFAFMACLSDLTKIKSLKLFVCLFGSN